MLVERVEYRSRLECVMMCCVLARMETRSTLVPSRMQVMRRNAVVASECQEVVAVCCHVDVVHPTVWTLCVVVEVVGWLGHVIVAYPDARLLAPLHGSRCTRDGADDSAGDDLL